MQLQAIIDLKYLTPAEAASFEQRCRALGIDPDKQLAALIKKDVRKTKKKAA